MSLVRLVSKYIHSAEHVLDQIKITVTSAAPDFAAVEKVVNHARAYLHDAKYYRERERFEVSLTSIAYCEGLLDALRLLGLVKFEWPAKEKESG